MFPMSCSTRVVKFVSILRYPFRWLAVYPGINRKKNHFISKTVTAQIWWASCAEHDVLYHTLTSCKKSAHTYHRWLIASLEIATRWKNRDNLIDVKKCNLNYDIAYTACCVIKSIIINIIITIIMTKHSVNEVTGMRRSLDERWGYCLCLILNNEAKNCFDLVIFIPTCKPNWRAEEIVSSHPAFCTSCLLYGALRWIHVFSRHLKSI